MADDGDDPRGRPPGATACVAVVRTLGGELLLIAAYQARLVAIALALFCFATAISFHNNFADQSQMIHFVKNVVMAGGLLQNGAFGAGSLSLDGHFSKLRESSPEGSIGG